MATLVAPPATCYAGSMALGNTALLFLGASFANMLRTAKPVRSRRSTESWWGIRRTRG